MNQIAWGSLGAENKLVLDGNVAGHRGSAIISWAGDEFGWNPFKKLSRAIKKVARKVSPVINVAATGASFVFPPAAPLAAGVAASVTILGKLDKGNKTQKAKAKAVILGTARRAKASKKRRSVVSTHKQRLARRYPRKGTIKGTITFSGDESGSERAFKVLRKVYKTREKAKKRGKKMAWVVSKNAFLMRVL